MNDDEIISGIKQRDPLALDALMNTYITPVYALCKRILGITAAAEDIEECTSDVFYEIWNIIDKFNCERAPFRTWVLIVAKYEALDVRRKLGQKSRAGVLNEQITASAAFGLSAAEEREELKTALKALSASDRELIYRRYFLNESITDLTKSYGLTRQAIDNRLWRARK